MATSTTTDCEFSVNLKIERVDGSLTYMPIGLAMKEHAGDTTKVVLNAVHETILCPETPITFTTGLLAMLLVNLEKNRNTSHELFDSTSATLEAYHDSGHMVRQVAAASKKRKATNSAPDFKFVNMGVKPTEKRYARPSQSSIQRSWLSSHTQVQLPSPDDESSRAALRSQDNVFVKEADERTSSGQGRSVSNTWSDRSRTSHNDQKRRNSISNNLGTESTQSLRSDPYQSNNYHPPASSTSATASATPQSHSQTSMFQPPVPPPQPRLIDQVSAPVRTYKSIYSDLRPTASPHTAFPLSLARHQTLAELNPASPATISMTAHPSAQRQHSTPPNLLHSRGQSTSVNRLSRTASPTSHDPHFPSQRLGFPHTRQQSDWQIGSTTPGVDLVEQNHPHRLPYKNEPNFNMRHDKMQHISSEADTGDEQPTNQQGRSSSMAIQSLLSTTTGNSSIDLAQAALAMAGDRKTAQRYDPHDNLAKEADTKVMDSAKWVDWEPRIHGRKHDSINYIKKELFSPPFTLSSNMAISRYPAGSEAHGISAIPSSQSSRYQSPLVAPAVLNHGNNSIHSMLNAVQVSSEGHNVNSTQPSAQVTFNPESQPRMLPNFRSVMNSPLSETNTPSPYLSIYGPVNHISRVTTPVVEATAIADRPA